MKRLLIYIALILTALPSIKAADGDLFPYPVPPADMERLDERCDFIVSRFWRGCDIKSAMSKMDKLNNTFADWINLMPYASADTVHSSIDRLLATVKKSGPQTLALARMAEAYAYSDTAQVYSEEIYYPFAKAAAEHKKIGNADKARFQSHVRTIENSAVGNIVKNLNYETPEGAPGDFNAVRTQMIVVMFADHKCDACTLARVRLSADVNATALQRAGLLTVMCIQPGEATDEWRAAASGYPQEWTIGASEDADEYFALRLSPTIYLLDGRHKVLAKDIPIDGLLNALATFRQNTGF